MISRSIIGAPSHRAACLGKLLFLALAGTVSSTSIAAQSQAPPDLTPKQRIDPGLAFALRTESDKRVSLPRLTQFPDAEVMKQVNTDLDTESARLASEAKRCDAAGQGKSSWEETVRVDLLTRDVLSIDVQVSYFCGGPHPDVEYSPLTYNLRTGKRFNFDTDADKLFLGDIVPSGELTALYKKHLGDPEEGCDPSFINEQSDLFLHFTADGLAIVPDLPHFAAACGPEIVIPWREIKPLVKPGNPFPSLFPPKPHH